LHRHFYVWTGEIRYGVRERMLSLKATLPPMRLKSGIWVAAYIRRCGVAGVFAAVRRRGAEEAGAIYVIVNRLDGTADLYGPAPQAAFDDAHPTDRAFTPMLKTLPAPETAVETYIARESRIDPDIWVVEIEERSGRHFLDRIVR
jgi:hypothetical protein